MSLAAVTLDDKYLQTEGQVFLTGTQALVRLPMMQRRLDLARGRNTAGYISGYRGSPLGGYDQSLWRAKRFLAENHIHFQPGVNEDLAATAIWGSQQTGLFRGAKYDGVFAVWYGKGPGADRCPDVFKHANAAGTNPQGGVLAIVGDDHGAMSSTLPHQSEPIFAACSMPVLAPINPQEFLDFGLAGWAMSRYSGCWIGFKLCSEGVESSSTVLIDPARFAWKTPEDFVLPPGGLNIRWPDTGMEQEYRLQRFKLEAAQAFVRANALDRIALDSPKARFGIATAGKSYLDVRQALDDLGIDAKLAAELGIRVYKIGLTWPLEPAGARRFAGGLEDVLVVEEKSGLIENQLKTLLYDLPAETRPRVVGKRDEIGAWLMPSTGELNPTAIARAIAARIARYADRPAIKDRLAAIERAERRLEREPAKTVRTPYFCSGCPHNSSTKVPEGSRALSGIGCHFLAQYMNRSTATYTQMGGEGVPWLGQAPFMDETHVFANIGDGTYYHSGLMAIRAAVAAKVNVTYKILFNDAVAMTGGQRHDGPLNPAMISRQVAAEGVSQVAVVTDEPDKYPIGTDFAPGTTVHHRDGLDEVQRRLRAVPGTSVLIYDQTCAAEKRRRRKRGAFPDPDKRAFINELVCEGCGDCSTASNCMSVIPLETPFGRKRRIDQSNCNKDFSCVNGFCPSFVTVHGGRPRKARADRRGVEADPFADLPLPEAATLERPYNILVTGVGGTGVITIGALLGMAAHIEGRSATLLDMTGLAQKGGAVLSHVRIARGNDQIHAVRLPVGGADLLLGCDMVVAGGREALSRTAPGQTRAVINAAEIPTAATVRNPDASFESRQLKRLIVDATGGNLAEFVDAGGLATALMGDSIATNLFMLGYAFQRGLIPLGLPSILRAIELNDVAVESSKRTFQWGRAAAHDQTAVEKIARPAMREPEAKPEDETLEQAIARRAAFLTAYQDAAYARIYADAIAEIRRIEEARVSGRTGLTMAAARYLFKLMAYKDEYEVARLYADPAFARKLAAQFEGDYRLRFHLAPPLFAERDPASGRLLKSEYGPWVMTAFRLLARLKFLRGTAWDLFGRTAERKAERQAILDYRARLTELASALTSANHALAVEIASIPELIRGYGHVKERHLADARKKEAELLAAFRRPGPEPLARAAE